MSQLEHHRRIDYVEFPVADVAVARRFYSYDFPGGRRFQFRDPCGHELAVWSDPVSRG